MSLKIRVYHEIIHALYILHDKNDKFSNSCIIPENFSIIYNAPLGISKDNQDAQP